jgi:dipeptidyl aminopeptidase/acylaminoacyl peptidase
MDAQPETQLDRAGYRRPPDPIPQILVAEPTPALSLSPARDRLALLARRNLVDLEELAAPELKLAGVRINPRTAGPSRAGCYYGLAFQPLESEAEPRPVALPTGTRLSSPRWSPDGRYLAFLSTVANGIEVWVADAAEASAWRLLGPEVSATLGAGLQWAPDGSSLLVKRVARPSAAEPQPAPVPDGPVIQENHGDPAPARTYQDLLTSPHDEALFEHHFTCAVLRVPLDGSDPVQLGAPGIYSEVALAPDGEHILVERVERPYSYLVPWNRFPAEVEVWSADGELLRRIADLPLAENVPVAFDAVPVGPRSFQWRADAPSTLIWAEALDGGDPRVDASLRDRVFCWDAPFDDEPLPLLDLEHRYAGIFWRSDELALCYSRWWATRRLRCYRLRPGGPALPPQVVFDRSYEDRYNDPGSPVLTRTETGQTVLLTTPDGESVYLTGSGASPAGDYPFLDRTDLATGDTERIWRARDPFYESVAAVLDENANRIIVRRESVNEPANYILLDVRGNTSVPLTGFSDPAPQLAGIGRELIRYPRADGVQLSGTLYTPPGYRVESDGPIPLLMWAYPREFLDREAAGQVSDSPNRFSRPAGSSPLFLLTQGYAVLDGPAMPIVRKDGEEPNDSYIQQLVLGAEAAVKEMVSRGIAKPGAIFIGGHSYGAAMAANLLAHTDLFSAGVARSGAYNRTLTPFGFQQEQRTYWEAPDVYHSMSPFSYADRLRHPLLLIHGAADNNAGTFPLQSDRFYHALKGQGARVRYVSLPLESHGYRARESVMHVLAEMIDWLGKHAGGNVGARDQDG